MKRTYSQIDLDERRKIERWRQLASVSMRLLRSLAAIARRFSARSCGINLRIGRCRI